MEVPKPKAKYSLAIHPEFDNIELRTQRLSQAKGPPRTTTAGFDWDERGHRKMVMLENTYRMVPKPEEAFRSHAASRLMENVLKQHLQDKNYHQMQSKRIATTIADVIKERVKAEGFSARYKYVCVVNIGEKKGQGVAVSSRCLWDTNTDNFASASYFCRDLYAVATLYAIYLE